MSKKQNGGFIGADKYPTYWNTRGVYSVNEINSAIIDYDWPVSASTINTSGLLLHLDAANPSSYPGSGTTWSDISGNGNNCTLYNGVTFSSNNGGYLVFNGSNSYAEIADNANLRPSSFTTSIWSYLNVLVPSPTCAPFSKVNASGSTSGWGHVINTNGTMTGFIKVGSTEYGVASTVGGYMRWFNFVMTVNSGSSMTTYLNGVSIGSTAIPATTNTNTFAIRLADSVDTFWSIFGGFISHVLYYNRVLSASEVTSNYNAIRGRYGL